MHPTICYEEMWTLSFHFTHTASKTNRPANSLLIYLTHITTVGENTLSTQLLTCCCSLFKFSTLTPSDHTWDAWSHFSSSTSLAIPKYFSQVRLALSISCVWVVPC